MREISLKPKHFALLFSDWFHFRIFYAKNFDKGVKAIYVSPPAKHWFSAQLVWLCLKPCLLWLTEMVGFGLFRVIFIFELVFIIEVVFIFEVVRILNLYLAIILGNNQGLCSCNSPGNLRCMVFNTNQTQNSVWRIKF